VVQVYGEPPGTLVERPARMLVAFQRFELEPGRSRRLSLAIDLQRLAYFDEASDGFRLEPGQHRLVVARHAEDEGLAVTIQLEARALGP
jgi:beta-glucosidase